MELKGLYDRLPNYTEGKHRVKKGDSWLSVEEGVFRKCITSYDQITINTKSYKHGIIFDVDQPDLYTAPEIASYTSTFNNYNDKAHQLFLFDKPIFTKSEAQKEWYSDNVASPLAKITFLVGADVNYKNTSTKNPFNTSSFRVREDLHILRSVFDLISLYNADLAEITAEEIAITKDGRYISVKYRDIIGELIEHSRLNSKLLFGEKTLFEQSLYLKSEHIAKDKGYSEALTKSVAADVVAYSFNWAKKMSELQRKRQLKRWGNQRQKTEGKIIDAIQTLKASSSKITYKAISLVSGVPLGSVKRYGELVKAER